MKFLVESFVGAALVAEIVAIFLGDNTQPDGWFLPTVDGQFSWMSREQFKNENSKFIDQKSVIVKYFLYTKSNPLKRELLYLDDVDKLTNSSFNKDNPTRFIIHGWQSDTITSDNLKIRHALMEVGDFNVILVDWTSISSSLNYATSRFAVPIVGKKVASFIDFLNETANMPFESLTLIGHSLGAHVCGYAGKNVKRGRIGVITGLDPAWPLFDYSNCNTRLCSTDAVFVDSIQTNGNLLGILEPIGKAAYYPNGGKFQPGCMLDFAGFCSHGRAVLYYAEALAKKNFVTIKCNSYEAAVAKDCGEINSNQKIAPPGSLLNEGCYYVPVNSRPPFGTG